MEGDDEKPDNVELLATVRMQRAGGSSMKWTASDALRDALAEVEKNGIKKVIVIMAYDEGEYLKLMQTSAGVTTLEFDGMLSQALKGL